jgi:hypothetical protein
MGASLPTRPKSASSAVWRSRARSGGGVDHHGGVADSGGGSRNGAGGDGARPATTGAGAESTPQSEAGGARPRGGITGSDSGSSSARSGSFLNRSFRGGRALSVGKFVRFGRTIRPTRRVAPGVDADMYTPARSGGGGCGEAAEGEECAHLESAAAAPGTAVPAEAGREEQAAGTAEVANGCDKAEPGINAPSSSHRGPAPDAACATIPHCAAATEPIGITD